MSHAIRHGGPRRRRPRCVWTGIAALAVLLTVWLATPATAAAMCLAAGVDIGKNGVPCTSCRAGDNVVLNSDRYLHPVPGYGAPLTTYRNYMINHGVGHRLGHSHVSCPGAGQLAPVMQQQTLGLQGCIANGWPYVNGLLYQRAGDGRVVVSGRSRARAR